MTFSPQPTALASTGYASKESRSKTGLLRLSLLALHDEVG
jgi:hypothetical protein